MRVVLIWHWNCSHPELYKDPAMTSSPPRLEIYNSPKRKRGAPDSIEYSPQVSPRTSRIATAISDYPFPQESEDRCEAQERGSPSSGVAGQLRTLDLQGTFVRQISFTDSGHAKKRFAQASEKSETRDAADRAPNEAQCASPPSKPANNVFPANVSCDPESSAFSSTIIDRPRAHSRSPPLDGNPDDNPMTWHESEITGHNPTDPNDDGYGINGIGFKPTPAIAWARSQRRKQQLADYRNREAREARERRSERRRGESAELSADSAANLKKRSATVRFGDVD
jgi:hypothetical protein